MRKLILLALICASFTLQAQTYKTVTMALDTPTNVAVLRAGTQSLNLNLSYLKRNDTTTYRTVLNSLTKAQIQTALNLKANLASPTFTGTVTATAFTDGLLTIGASQINRASGNIEIQFGGNNGVRMFGNGPTPITFGTTGSITATSFTEGFLTIEGAQINRPAGGFVELQFQGAGGVKMFGNTATPITFGTTGTITATSFIKTGGTASQFLKGDGSVDATSYASTASPTFTGDVQVPAIPVNATSAVSKSFVDNAITGITWKAASRVATTANIVLSGTQTIDAIALIVGDRVLVKNQTAQTENGIYIVSAGAWTRSLDADSGTEIETATVAVTLGTLNKNTQWTCTATAITIGTTAITFTTISGAGTYASGAGLSLTGNVFAVDATVARASDLTPNTIPLATGANTLVNSAITQIAGNVAIGTTTPTEKLHVVGNGLFNGLITSNGSAGGIQWSSRSDPNGLWSLTADNNASYLIKAGNVIEMAFNNGNEVIGYTSDQGFKLAVNGTGFYNGALTATSFIKTGGLSTQKLNADGSVDATVYQPSLGFTPLNKAGDSMTGRLIYAPATVSISSFRMPTGVAPTTPVTGDWWSLGLRTQTFDGTQTKDVLFDKANSVLAGFGLGAVITDNLGNLSVAPVADRTTSNTTTKTANYTVVLSDVGANGTLFIRADATAGNMIITLPTALVMSGLTVITKKVDATANTVTISGSSIDGVTTKVLSGLNVFTSITSNGTVFNIVGDRVTNQTVAGTGWADYTDNIYTSASPLSIASGVTVTLTNNAATSTTSQLPVGVTSLYNSATSKITPATAGDAYGISIRFKAKSTSPTDFFDFGIDIGGAVGVIFKQTRTFIKGANTEVAFDININAFSLATFVANGGLVKITAGNGTMTVYDIVYDIFRTHKGF